MIEKMTLTEAFKKVLNKEITQNDYSKYIFDKNFLSSITMDQLSYIAKNTYTSDMKMSAFIHSIYYRPLELAKSPLLDICCEEFDIFRKIGVDKFRNALNNGKEKDILNYLYNDLPKKVIQRNVDAIEDPEVKTYIQEKLSHFIIPSQKKIKNISLALNFIDHFDNYKLYGADVDLHDFMYYLEADNMFSQTDQGLLYQAELYNLNFKTRASSYWQSIFEIKDGEFYANTDNQLLNKHLDEVFDLKNLTADEKISFYVNMVFEDYDASVSPEANIVEDCTEELLKIVVNCQNKDSQITVYNICAGHIEDYFYTENNEKALNIIHNDTFKSLAIKFNQNIDLNLIYNKEEISDQIEAFNILFSNCILRDACFSLFDSNDVIEKLLPLLEKQEIRTKLKYF